MWSSDRSNTELKLIQENNKEHVSTPEKLEPNQGF